MRNTENLEDTREWLATVALFEGRIALTRQLLDTKCMLSFISFYYWQLVTGSSATEVIVSSNILSYSFIYKKKSCQFIHFYFST